MYYYPDLMKLKLHNAHVTAWWLVNHPDKAAALWRVNALAFKQ